ncbi:MAG: hypothetical protein JEY96_07570 [Bacteroidales bacterium]|nr:hypothetical protein [Bacteroidales bacterium]
MKRILLALISILFFNVSYSSNPDGSEDILLTNNLSSETFTLNKNYQQFKYQLVNLETNDLIDYGSLKKRRRRKKNDNLMLYVAGGLAVATATLILVNDPDNFTSNSSSSVNIGIAAGGTVACGMIVAKFFLDKKR